MKIYRYVLYSVIACAMQPVIVWGAETPLVTPSEATQSSWVPAWAKNAGQRVYETASSWGAKAHEAATSVLKKAGGIAPYVTSFVQTSPDAATIAKGLAEDAKRKQFRIFENPTAFKENADLRPKDIEAFNTTLRTIAQAPPISSKDIEDQIITTLSQQDQQYIQNRFFKEANSSTAGSLVESNSLPTTQTVRDWATQFVNTYESPYTGSSATSELKKAYVGILTDFFSNFDIDNVMKQNDKFTFFQEKELLFIQLSKKLMLALKVRIVPQIVKQIQENAKNAIEQAGRAQEDYAHYINKLNQRIGEEGSTNKSNKKLLAKKKIDYDAELHNLARSAAINQKKAIYFWLKSTFLLAEIAAIRALPIIDSLFSLSEPYGADLIRKLKSGWGWWLHWYSEYEKIDINHPDYGKDSDDIVQTGSLAASITGERNTFSEMSY